MLNSRFNKVCAYFMVPNGKGDWMAESSMLYYSKMFNINIYIPGNSINDLASIPVFLRRLFPINGPSRPAAVVHDYLYSTKGLSGRFTRKECDQIFLEAMLTSKSDFWDAYPESVKQALKAKGMHEDFISDEPLVNEVTAKLMYHGVRIGGGGHF